MKCRICGGAMREVVTDLPLKLNQKSIIIFKELPVLQCENCSEYLIEDAVMDRVEATIDGVDKEAELEIIRYAA